MPDDTLNVELPEDGSGDNPDPNGSDADMSNFEIMAEQNMAQLAQTGVVAQNNFVTSIKALDLDYIEGKRMVSLEESLGAREVASKVTPGGPSPAA